MTMGSTAINRDNNFNIPILNETAELLQSLNAIGFNYLLKTVCFFFFFFIQFFFFFLILRLIVQYMMFIFQCLVFALFLVDKKAQKQKQNSFTILSVFQLPFFKERKCTTLCIISQFNSFCFFVVAVVSAHKYQSTKITKKQN